MFNLSETFDSVLSNEIFYKEYPAIVKAGRMHGFKPGTIMFLNYLVSQYERQYRNGALTADGEFYYTASKVEEVLSMSVKQRYRALKELKDAGVLTAKRTGEFKIRMYVKFNFDVLMDFKELANGQKKYFQKVTEEEKTGDSPNGQNVYTFAFPTGKEEYKWIKTPNGQNVYTEIKIQRRRCRLIKALKASKWTECPQRESISGWTVYTDFFVFALMDKMSTSISIKETKTYKKNINKKKEVIVDEEVNKEINEKVNKEIVKKEVLKEDSGIEYEHVVQNLEERVEKFRAKLFKMYPKHRSNVYNEQGLISHIRNCIDFGYDKAFFRYLEIKLASNDWQKDGGKWVPNVLNYFESMEYITKCKLFGIKLVDFSPSEDEVKPVKKEFVAPAKDLSEDPEGIAFVYSKYLSQLEDVAYSYKKFVVGGDELYAEDFFNGARMVYKACLALKGTKYLKCYWLDAKNADCDLSTIIAKFKQMALERKSKK